MIDSHYISQEVTCYSLYLIDPQLQTPQAKTRELFMAFNVDTHQAALLRLVVSLWYLCGLCLIQLASPPLILLPPHLACVLRLCVASSATLVLNYKPILFNKSLMVR